MLYLISDFFRLGPREFFKQDIKLPIIEYIDNSLQIFKTKAQNGIHSTKDVVLKALVVAVITSVLVWLSIFMYMAFYYTYVPAVAHQRPVYLQFVSSKYNAEGSKNHHSYPTAHVELTKRQQLLMLGQAYRINLHLEVPESPVNKEMGMFMVCAEFYSKDKNRNKHLIAQSCRSSMLHYRSPLIDTIYTLVFSPFFIFGASEEKQNLNIELFSRYEEEEGPTVTDVHIEIQSTQIQVYSANFLIAAEFSGLRYFMFNWPVVSAALGISSNLFIIAVIGFLCWHQMVHSEEYRLYRARRSSERSNSDITPVKFEEDSYSSSSLDDISILEKQKDRSSCESEEVIEDLRSELSDKYD